jgi:hypothetical protein
VRAFGNHGIDLGLGKRVLAQMTILAFEPRHLERTRNDGTKLVFIERLCNVVEGALPYCLYGG